MSENKLFQCSECGKEYAYNKNLRQHVSKAHPGKVDVVAPSLRSQKLYAFKCNICDKNFSFEKNLNHHKRRDHGEVSYRRRFLRCALCECEVPTGKCLSEHLAVEHEIQLKCEYLNFSSFADFQNWKHEVEKSTCSSYVKNGSSKVTADNTVLHYYYCHRSGHYRSKSKGIRRLKAQGSNKMSAVCPAKMKVIQAGHGTCVVKFVSTHVGHENDPIHLNLSLREKAGTARRVPFQAIVEKNRDTVTDSKLDRIHLLTKQDSEETVSNERQAILVQVSVPGISNEPLSLAQEKDLMAAELLDLINGVNSVSELNVFKNHIACLKATLTTVRNQNGQVPTFKLTDVSPNRKVSSRGTLYVTKKRRVSHRSPLPKPGASETQPVAVSLLHERLLVDEEMQGNCGSVTVNSEEIEAVPLQQNMQYNTSGLESMQCAAMEHNYAVRAQHSIALHHCNDIHGVG